MRLVLGLLAYLFVVVAVGSGAVAIVSSLTEPSARTAVARSEPTAMASPRIQAWLERKAEGVAFAEKEKAAAQAERERADALRARLAATPDPVAVARTRDNGEKQAAEYQRAERAARAKESAKREARRLRQMEAQAAYGYAAEPRRSAYPDDFLTRRDRYGY
jgi:hypothetical protein